MKYSDFDYWFKYRTNHSYDVYKNNEYIGYIVQDIEDDYAFYTKDGERNYSDVIEITDCLSQYFKRDEHIVGRKVNIEGKPIDEAINIYKKLISGAIKIRALKNEKDPDEQESYIQGILDWIDTTDFYDAPASTIYHESFPHGLLSHTFRVYNEMCDLIQIPKFQNIDIDSSTIVCLMHDWCKIGLYESYKRNVKNEKTGVWEQVDSYRRKESLIPLGHGVQSMCMANKFIKLTTEELLAIRWHMGRWYVDDGSIDDLQKSNENYPLVHLLQFADQLAIVNY